MSKPPFRASSGRTENKIHRQGKRAEEGKVEPPKKKTQTAQNTKRNLISLSLSLSSPTLPVQLLHVSSKAVGFLSVFPFRELPHARSRTASHVPVSPPPAPPSHQRHSSQSTNSNGKKEGRKKKEEEKNPEEVSEGRWLAVFPPPRGDGDGDGWGAVIHS